MGIGIIDSGKAKTRGNLSGSRACVFASCFKVRGLIFQAATLVAGHAEKLCPIVEPSP
jgi:hypothetical protein